VWLAIAVIGIIAAIAIPAYSDYTKKAKTQASGNVPQTSIDSQSQLNQPLNKDIFSQIPEAITSNEKEQITAREESGQIKWDNERYGVKPANENNFNVQTKQDADRLEKERMEREERLWQEAERQKKERVEMTAKLEAERLENEGIENGIALNASQEQKIREDEIEKNRAKWLEREQENARNRTF